MKPLPSEPSDLVNRLRQQLILAQVRIMELEDVRDMQVPRLAEMEQLLQEAQTLADRKFAECSHLEKVLADLQTQCDRLLQAQRQAAQDLATLHDEGVITAGRLADSQALASRLASTVEQREAELLALRSSRSWRWTAWLRTLTGKPHDR